MRAAVQLCVVPSHEPQTLPFLVSMVPAQQQIESWKKNLWGGRSGLQKGSSGLCPFFCSVWTGRRVGGFPTHFQATNTFWTKHFNTFLSTVDARRFFGPKWLRKALYWQSHRAPPLERCVRQRAFLATCRRAPAKAARRFTCLARSSSCKLPVALGLKSHNFPMLFGQEQENSTIQQEDPG